MHYILVQHCMSHIFLLLYQWSDLSSALRVAELWSLGPCTSLDGVHMQSRSKEAHIKDLFWTLIKCDPSSSGFDPLV